MKYCLSFILLIFFLPAFGQKNKKSKAPPPPSIDELIENIDKPATRTNTTKYKLKERQKFYPFSKAAQIMLVSFDKQEPIELKINDGKTLTAENIYPPLYGLPFLNDTIDFSKIDQKVILIAKEVDTLTDILYNTCSRWSVHLTSKSACYHPHNAILFLDKNGNLLEYIEICFDCNQFLFSSNKIKQFEDCDNAVSELQSYFKILGLKSSTFDFK